MGSDSYLKREVPHSGAVCHDALLYDVSSREVLTPLHGTVLYHTSCYDLHQGGDEHLIHYLRRRRGGGRKRGEELTHAMSRASTIEQRRMDN